MIRLFVTDLDGCVSHPFRPPDWDAAVAIARLHRESIHDPTVPPLTICTGRPLAYAEAVGQWLAVSKPLLFESGSGMFDPVSNQVTWSPDIDAATEAALAELRAHIHHQLVPQFPGTVAEFAKQRDVGLTNPDRATIDKLHHIILELVAEMAQGALEVHYTDVSVNVIPSAANKGAGLVWLGQTLAIPCAEMAYIGDSLGDLSALRAVGAAFAPQNAMAAVRDVAEVTRGEATLGVLEAYRAVIARNRASADPEGS